jgi:hypothetical protein
MDARMTLRNVVQRIEAKDEECYLLFWVISRICEESGKE